MCSCESVDGSGGGDGGRMPVGSAVAAALPLGPELNSTSSANRCGEVPVVGEGDDAPGRVGREPADEQQRVAGGHPEQVGVLRAGQAGGDDLADRGDPVAVRG